MEIQKKISFGFSKSSKLVNIFKPKLEEKKNDVELIECLEGQSIKIRNVVEDEKKPLIIPLRDNAKNLFDRVKNFRGNKDNDDKQKDDTLLSLDELAAKQLIEEAAQRSSNNYTQITKVEILPMTDNKVPNQNDNESTLDDYNDVPINDFGMAMLRGMGWTESTGIGNQNKQITNISEPELRPRGLGLGANKIIKLKETLAVLDKDGQELSLTKGAFAKVIAGKHKGNYCEVLSLDDETGRIIVKTAIKQNILSINECLLTPVTKDDYNKNSKVLNNAKYEEYANKSNRNESVDAKSDNREYKINKRKAASPSSDERNSKNLVHKSSSRDNGYDRHRDRSRSPYKSKHKRSVSPEGKRKSTKVKQRSDYSDSDEDEERKRRKKTRKHRKYDQDSSDEEYRKRKKSSKSKKHRSHKKRYSSDEDTSRSKYKHKHRKTYR